MIKEEIGKEVSKVKVETIKEEKGEKKMKKNEFTSLKDLTSEDVKNWDKVPVKFLQTVNKKFGNERVSISLKLSENVLKTLILAPGGKFLSQTRFELIKTVLELPVLDRNGRPNSEWNRIVPIRFVQGKTVSGFEYRMIEILYKQFYYESHFLDSDTNRLISLLEEQGKWPYTWIERPDAIDDLQDLDISLTF